MSWYKVVLNDAQCWKIHSDRVPEHEATSAMPIALAEWVLKWCEANCKDRARVSYHMQEKKQDGLTGGPARLFKVMEVKAFCVKFKNADDAMIFRLTF